LKPLFEFEATAIASVFPHIGRDLSAAAKVPIQLYTWS
jgi:hypothetical protein